MNSNHGVVHGATSITDRFGSTNSAYNFDGSNYIAVLDDPTLQVQSLTLSAWVKLTYTNGLQLIIDKHLGSGTLDSYEMWRQGDDIWGLIGND